MILLTARVLRGGEIPVYDQTKKQTSLILADGRQVSIEVQEVAVAFEIEEKKP